MLATIGLATIIVLGIVYGLGALFLLLIQLVGPGRFSLLHLLWILTWPLSFPIAFLLSGRPENQ